MPFYAYVLYSRSHKRYYKGHCENLEDRIDEHNKGKTKSTKAFIPWKLYYYEVFSTRQEAIKREKYFKTAAGRRYLTKKIKKE
ncbi:MAG: GIY-YIG nuclease family protein [Bacteroidales bacterium]|nr:GIY-YIG nuclease family protein [Bacteroidales bacterium]MCF8333340.1 GIY-YIG nuclease family protein [Bacteroidales bacterium]